MLINILSCEENLVKNELGFALLAVNLRKYTAKSSQNMGLYFYFPKNQKRKSICLTFASGFYFLRLIFQPLFHNFVIISSL